MHAKWLSIVDTFLANEPKPASLACSSTPVGATALHCDLRWQTEDTLRVDRDMDKALSCAMDFPPGVTIEIANLDSTLRACFEAYGSAWFYGTPCPALALPPSLRL